MTAISLPRKMVWTPSSSLRIDWSNPITRGLVYCVIGDMVIDLASGKLSSRSVTNGTITNSVTPAGVGLKFSGANSVKASRKILGNGDASILLVADPAAESAGRSLTLQSGGVGLLTLVSNSDHLGGGGVPGQMCWLWLQSGVERSAILVPSVIDGKLHTHVITKSAGVASAFVDGAKKSISIFGSLSNSLTSAADTYQVGGNDQSSATSPNCTINANFVWSRKLSDGEAAAVSANPLQIFAPRETRLFVPIGGGGAVNATASGAFPSVSLSANTAGASGSASASGSLAAITISASTATASAGGSATASGSFSALSISPATATATATKSATASGAFATISLSAPTATATGTTAGGANATGTPAQITISQATAIAIGSAVASGGLQSIGITAPTGTASAGNGNATATGAWSSVSITAPTGYASSGFIRAPAGSGPTVIQPGGYRPSQSATSRPSNTGGRRY